MYTLYSLVISATWDGFDEVQELSVNVILDILSFGGGGGVNTQQVAGGGTENSGGK